jgi:dinuclear metal center YbgI/SA1388 family protein
MKINDITTFLEMIASVSLQEHYDNAGLITGDVSWECTGIICSLDATEEVVHEAIDKKCNLIVAHHPIIFNGLKKINGKNYVEKTIITAIKNDIAIYAIHTNLDNVLHGVSGRMAEMLGLKGVTVLAQEGNTLKKLYTFVPLDKADQVRSAIFNAGGGNIGNYSEASFNTEGVGTFKAGDKASPFVGELGKYHEEKEVKIEVIYPTFLENGILAALRASHPYEEVAYDIITLTNLNQQIGSGVLGELEVEMEEKEFLTWIKEIFKIPVVRHTAFLGKPVKTVALCGGAGSFLISKALASKADAYITSDIKYHEFFDANKSMLIADIGHFESEQFTINLLQEILDKKFPTFAVLKTEVKTNPVHYY